MSLKFTLGQIVATPAALETIEKSGQTAAEFLSRHADGDWLNLCPEDRAANERAIREGLRIMSVYKTQRKNEIWIITEADRSVSTILLPEEY